jgi:hypothetical protein
MLTREQLAVALNMIISSISAADQALIRSSHLSPFIFLHSILAMLIAMRGNTAGVYYDVLNYSDWLQFPRSNHIHYSAIVHLWHRFTSGDLRDVDLRNVPLFFTFTWPGQHAQLHAQCTRMLIAAYLHQRRINAPGAGSALSPFDWPVIIAPAIAPQPVDSNDDENDNNND